MSHQPSRILFAFVLFVSAPAWAASVHIPDGTPIPLRLKGDLSSSRAEVGDRVDFTVVHAVIVQGVVAVPEGSVAWGAVQSVKKDKEIKFDITGLRLPNLREIKLRSVRQKTSNPGKDQIKLETHLGDTVGAAVGTEFTAYIDEDIDVESAEASSPASRPTTPPASRPPEVKPAAQAVAPAAAAPVTSAPPVSTSQPAPVQSVPAPSATTTTARPAIPSPTSATPVQSPQPQAPSRAVAQATPATAPTAQEPGTTAERVTVECFSDPSGADIVINDEYYGNTPSILKLLPTTLRVEFKLPGYKTDSRTLDLTVVTGLRTIRGVLEKKE